MSEHTPLPWRWDNAALLGPKDTGLGFDDCILRCLGNCGPEPEDEDFLLRACNSYDDLLAALVELYYGILRSIPVGPGVLQPELAQARAAIAKTLLPA